MEQNTPLPTFTESTDPTQTQPKQKNSFVVFVGYFLWFFLTGGAIWILMETWKEPFILSYTLSSWFFNIAIIMSVPALVTSLLLTYRNKKTKYFIGIVLLATVVLLTIFTFASGESGLGVLIYSGLIITALTGSFVVVAIIKTVSDHWPTKFKYVLGGTTLVLFLIIGLRIVMFSNPNASSCSSLDTHGRSECFARLAEQNNEVQWCYAIETDSYAPIKCIQKIGIENLTLAGCDMLRNANPSNPYQGGDIERCAEDYFSSHGNLSDCETVAKEYMSTSQCINLILKENQDAKKTSDCSVFTDQDSKMQCYHVWQGVISGGINSSKTCKLVTDRYEQDICYYSYFYGITGMSYNPPAFEGICKNITNVPLRNQCLDLVKKLMD